MTDIVSFNPSGDTAGSLVVFEDARRAIVAAETVDQVNNIVAMATGIAAAARAATDREMEAEAEVLKLEAERKLGQLMTAQKETIGFNKGGGDQRSDHRDSENPGGPPTLAEAGIDKNLAKRARAAASMSEPEFEAAKEAKRDVVLTRAQAEPEQLVVEPSTTSGAKRTRRSSKEILLERADNTARSIWIMISGFLDDESETADAALNYLLTKYLGELVAIAGHPKFDRIVAAVQAKPGCHGSAPDRESEIRLIGLQSENEELRARIAELEAASEAAVSPNAVSAKGATEIPDDLTIPDFMRREPTKQED
jgi:hypothetical protein